MSPSFEARTLARLASAGLALVLVVVLASAAIRLGQAAAPPFSNAALLALRAVHRTAASLEVLAVTWLGWLAWRARFERPQLAAGVALAVVLTAVLSVIGILAGQNPPPAAALANMLGGLSLAAAFAWLCGTLRPPVAPAARFVAGIAALLGLQCLLGARLSILPGAAASPALPAHAMLGIALTAFCGWIALRSTRPAQRKALLTAVLVVPVLGFTALQYESSLAAALLHAAAAALLVVGAAYGRLRPA
jgi:hypothetical protein